MHVSCLVASHVLIIPNVTTDVPSVAEAGQNDTMDTQSSSSRGTGRDGDVTSSEVGFPFLLSF